MREQAETGIVKECMLAAAECGATVLRNHRGMFLTLDGKRKVAAGLSANGSSDLIGWTADGRFLAIEVKTSIGRVSKQQQHFIDTVNASGGIAFIARSAQDVKDKLCNAHISAMQK